MFKNKKFKFAFIVVLIALTLLAMSIYYTMSNCYDPAIKKHAQLLVDNNEQFIQIEKSDFYYKDEITTNYKELTDADFKQLSQKLKGLGKTGKEIYRIASLHIESNDIMGYAISIYDLLKINPEVYSSSKPDAYWYDEFDIVEWDDSKDFFVDNITGRMPEGYDEIMISNHLADLLLTVGLKPYGEDDYYKPGSYENLVTSNKYFYFGVADKVKIVGVINYDLSKFTNMKNISWDEYNYNLEKYSAIGQELSDKTKNIYNKIYVNKDFINHLNVNGEITLDTIWKNKIIKTGILVMENTENGFKKLLSEFKYDEPITARSTYSEFLDMTTMPTK